MCKGPQHSWADSTISMPIGISLQQLLFRLRKNVPGFVDYFCEEQSMDVNG